MRTVQQSVHRCAREHWISEHQAVRQFLDSAVRCQDRWVCAAMTLNPDRCGVPWPVCCDCLGVGLECSAVVARCPSCGRVWEQSEVIVCPWPRSATLMGTTGATLMVCASHAAHPGAALLGRDRWADA